MVIDAQNAAIQLLEGMGVIVDSDDPVFQVIENGAVEKIQNMINQNTVPEGLTYALAYMITGEYLRFLKNTGRLVDGAGESLIDTSGVMKSLKEGDTDITFASGASEGVSTPEQLIDDLIANLTGYVSRKVGRYRKLVW